MATFEQALDKAFEVTWRLGEDVDVVTKVKGHSADHMDELMIEGTHQTFIGAVNVLGSLLLLAGRIDTFEMVEPVEPNGDPGRVTAGWVEGSSLASKALGDWGLANGKISQADYDTTYGRGASA